MSQWRRIAIEEVPSCRKLIEEAESPWDMWYCLRQEATAPNENVRREIYKSAVRCDEDRNMPHYLVEHVDLFFRYVVGLYMAGGYEERENPSCLRKDLPKYLTTKQFLHWVDALSQSFDTKQMTVAMMHFRKR